MAGEIIRKGDPTDHGGTVLEGSLTDLCHGKPIAYMGHKVYCPQCKGTYPIGVLTTTFYGKGVAVAGMKTACGATLVATQFTDIVETGGGSVLKSGTSQAATGVAASVTAAATAAHDERKKDGDNEKKIKAIFWSFGKDETAVSGFSRFYVDLNLHVETENYSPGEMVEISIEDDEGADVLEGVKKITLRAPVDADGNAKLLNAFRGKTLITVPGDAAT